MDLRLNAAHNKNLTLELFGLFSCFCAIRVAAEDLFGAYIFSIGGTSGLSFKQVAQLATGGKGQHQAEGNDCKTEVFHCMELAYS